MMAFSGMKAPRTAAIAADVIGPSYGNSGRRGVATFAGATDDAPQFRRQRFQRGLDVLVHAGAKSSWTSCPPAPACRLVRIGKERHRYARAHQHEVARLLQHMQRRLDDVRHARHLHAASAAIEPRVETFRENSAARLGGNASREFETTMRQRTATQQQGCSLTAS